MNLAEKLTIQRKRSGMSQEQLADRLGITRQSVSKWEAGSSIPEISKLVALSEIFQVSLDYLLKDYLDEENGRFPAGDRFNGEIRSPGEDMDYEGMQSNKNSRFEKKTQLGKNPQAEENSQVERNLQLEEKVDELARYIRGYQYTSKTKIAGIPLVSIRFSRQLARDGVARGIIAIGNLAIGVISVGAVSIGVISFGALAVGLLAIGAFAVGIAAWGALAIGVVAFGATAIGIYSAGGTAVGKEIAVGAAAVGETAIGRNAEGTHCLLYEQGVTTRPQLEQFLQETNPHLWKPLRDMLVIFAMHL